MSDIYNVYLNGRKFVTSGDKASAVVTARNVLTGNNDAFIGPPLPDHPRKVTLTAENDRGYETFLGEHISTSP